MEKQYRVVGLSKPSTVTCQTEKEETFCPKVNMDKDAFEKMFSYCKFHWDEPLFANLQFSELSETGVPVNSVLLSIQHK